MPLKATKVGQGNNPNSLLTWPIWFWVRCYGDASLHNLIGIDLKGSEAFVVIHTTTNAVNTYTVESLNN